MRIWKALAPEAFQKQIEYEKNILRQGWSSSRACSSSTACASCPSRSAAVAPVTPRGPSQRERGGRAGASRRAAGWRGPDRQGARGGGKFLGVPPRDGPRWRRAGHRAGTTCVVEASSGLYGVEGTAGGAKAVARGARGRFDVRMACARRTWCANRRRSSQSLQPNEDRDGEDGQRRSSQSRPRLRFSQSRRPRRPPPSVELREQRRCRQLVLVLLPRRRAGEGASAPSVAGPVAPPSWVCAPTRSWPQREIIRGRKPAHRCGRGLRGGTRRKLTAARVAAAFLLEGHRPLR